MAKFETVREFKVEDEYPLQAEAAGAYRTETFNQWAYDPVQNIGLNIWFASGQHGGGQPFPNFMSTVIIYLGETRFTMRGAGSGNHDGGIAAGNSFLTMIEPFKRWKIDSLGLLDSGEGGAPLLGRLDLVVDIVTPPIEQGSQGDRGEVASSGTAPRTAIRYEQLCHITGLVRLGDRAIEIDALGVRSHRRNSASIYDSGAVGHSWATGLFPSGRGFHLLSRRTEPNAEVGSLYGHYFDGQRYREAEVTRYPYYTGGRGAEQSLLEMRVAGKTLEIQVESYPPQMSEIPPQGIRLTRAPAKYVLDGEAGGGVLERSLAPRFEAGGDYRGS